MAVNRELLEETLDIIRQSLQADGGDVELIDVNDEGVVTLEMQVPAPAALCPPWTCLRASSASSWSTSPA